MISASYGFVRLPLIAVQSDEIVVEGRSNLLNPLNNSLEYNGISIYDIKKAAAYEYEWSTDYQVRYIQDFLNIAWLSTIYDQHNRFQAEQIEEKRKKASANFSAYSYPTPPEYIELRKYEQCGI